MRLRRGASVMRRDPWSEIIFYACQNRFFGRVREGLFDSKSRLPQSLLTFFLHCRMMRQR